MQVAIDIETIPQQPESAVRALIAETIKAPSSMSKPETIADWHNGAGKYAGEKDRAIDEAYRRTALNGAKGQIVSIAWAIEGSAEVHGKIAIPGESTESDILAEFFSAVLNDCKGRPPQFAGHFVGGFDLPFLFQRSVILGIYPGFDLGQWGRHGSQFFDTMQAWAGFKGSISLDDLCIALGIPGKGDGITGATVWDEYKAGNYQGVLDYNKDDVRRVQQIMRRLQYQEAA